MNTLKTTTRRALALVVGLPLLACGSPAPEGDADAATGGAGGAAATEGGPADTGGWQVLFDGSGLEHWRGYQREDLPSAWRVEDAALAFVPGGEGGDIVTREEYGDFELELEWRISPGGNSGIFYRAVETEPAIYMSAPEMQVLDDGGHDDGGSGLTSAGSNYALHAAEDDVTRPVGEWNRVRIVVRGAHVEHWLNGVKVVEYELGGADWVARVADSKFAAWPAYGQAERGRIGLQDHGDPVWFRHIRIRPLEGRP